MNKLMKWYGQLSFFKKQLLVATIVTSVTLVLASTLLYGKFIGDHKKSLLDNLQGKAELISSTSRSALLFGDQESATTILNSLEAFPTTQFGLILDANGELFAQFRRDNQSAELDLALMQQGSHLSEEQVYVYRPIEMDGEVIGYFIIAADTRVLADQRLNYFLILLAVFLVSIGVSFFLHWRLQSFIAAPMNKLVELVGYVARNRRYHKRIGTTGNDELGTLISGVNSMLDTIEEHEHQLHSHSERLESLVALRTEQLFNRANYDALTQLPNRHLLVDRLNHGIDNASRENSPNGPDVFRPGQIQSYQ